LLVFVLRPRVQSPVGFLPTLTLVGEPRITPHLPFIRVFFPLLFRNGLDLLLDRIVDLSGGQKTDAQVVKQRKILLVEKSGIHPDDDRYRASSLSMTMVSSVSITTRIFSRRKRQRNNSCNTQRKAPAWTIAKDRTNRFMACEEAICFAGISTTAW